MPLGVVTDTEFEKELERLNRKPPVNTIVVPIATPGRTEGKVNTPEPLRKVIAEEALSGTSPKELEKIFNVSQSSISAYKNGATSTASYNQPDKELGPFVDKVKGNIAKSARDKLFLALDNITSDNIINAKLKDKSQLAKDMSVIIKNMEPPGNTNNGVQVQFVYHAPPLDKENAYEVIDIDN